VNIVVQVARERNQRERHVVEIVQVVHPYDLDEEAAELADRYEAEGKIKKIWDTIRVLTLYRREGGRLVHIAEPLPVVGRDY
jgi:hypothetical protein